VHGAGTDHAKPPHLIPESLQGIEHKAVETLSVRIEELTALSPGSLSLSTLSGVNRRFAELMLSEFGAKSSRFQRHRHLASRAGLRAGNNESAGKRKSGQDAHGIELARSGLVDAAKPSRSKSSYPSAR
jgi:hypothetical protein